MDGREDNGPSEALDVGGGVLESHNEQKEMIQKMVVSFKKEEEESSVRLM